MAFKHSIYDTDTHFKVDPATRTLINEMTNKSALIQGDHNSERITFELPRFIEGHDLSQCDSVQVHFVNTDLQTKAESKGVYDVDDLQISPDGEDVVICSWLVSYTATTYVGSLHFLLRFSCKNEDSELTYVWNTAPYTKITVLSGIYNGDVIEEALTEDYDRYRSELLVVSEETKKAVEDMADQAVSDAQTAVDQAEDKALETIAKAEAAAEERLEERLPEAYLDLSITHYELKPEEDGKFYLEIGKIYKVYAPKNADSTAFNSAFYYGFKDDGAVRYENAYLSLPTTKYECDDSYTIQVVDYYIPSSMRFAHVFVRVNGGATEEVSSNAIVDTNGELTEKAFYVTNATKVLVVNDTLELGMSVVEMQALNERTAMNEENIADHSEALEKIGQDLDDHAEALENCTTKVEGAEQTLEKMGQDLEALKELQEEVKALAGQNEYIGSYTGTDYTESTIQTVLSNFVKGVENRDARDGDIVNIVSAGSGADYSGQQWICSGGIFKYYIDFENHSVIDNLDSDSAIDGLSARMGKLLNKKVDETREAIPEVKTDLNDFGEEGPSDTATVSQRALLQEFDNYVPAGHFSETVTSLERDINGMSDAIDGAYDQLEQFGDEISETSKPYELLHSVTITEPAEGEEPCNEVRISKDSAGNPLNLKAFYLYIKFPISTAEKTLDGHIVGFLENSDTDNINLLNFYTNKVTSTTAIKYFFANGILKNGMWTDVWKTSQAKNNKDENASKVFFNHSSLVTKPNRTRMEFYLKFSNSTVAFDTGTEIKLYGVRV